uniref:Uncharacterized protein n=1 Tax=viral metagenome TaxID=1070528 RepID=A0A6H1ZR29_9ZZZZ
MPIEITERARVTNHEAGDILGDMVKVIEDLPLSTTNSRMEIIVRFLGVAIDIDNTHPEEFIKDLCHALGWYASDFHDLLVDQGYGNCGECSLEDCNDCTRCDDCEYREAIGEIQHVVKKLS